MRPPIRRWLGRPDLRCTAVVIAGVMLVAPVPWAWGRSVAPEPDLTLRDCLLSGVSFDDDPERLADEGWVPSGYEPHSLIPGSATVLVWVMRCDNAEGDTVDPGPVGMAIVGVATPPEVDPDPTTWAHLLEPVGGPMNWGIYVVAVHSDSIELTRFLRDAGLPASTATRIELSETPDYTQPELRVDLPDLATCQHLGLVPGLSHALPAELTLPEPAKRTVAEVDAQASYRTSTHPVVHHNIVTHCHDQLLWHGPRENADRVRMVIPVARDHFCVDPLPDCGSAAADGWVADFLGQAGVRDDPSFAFDHDLIPVVYLTAEG